MLAKRDFRERAAEPAATRVAIRDPEDRSVAEGDAGAVREKMLDKTLADSYPASDPPSSIPDPSTDSVAVRHRPPWNFDRAA